MKIKILKEGGAARHGAVYDPEFILNTFRPYSNHLEWATLCHVDTRDSQDTTTFYQQAVTCPQCLVKIDELLESGTLAITSTMDKGRLYLPRKKKTPLQAK
jgi:hypothetical protein